MNPVLDATEPCSSAQRTYRLLWRWHFYAGLFCIPFILLLSVSGGLYLFKPQVEHWQDRAFDTVSFAGAPVGATWEVEAALAAHAGSRFDAYEVAATPGGAGRVWLRNADGSRQRVVIHPVDGTVLDDIREDERLMQVIKDLHGELLLGSRGSLVVELAACWALLLVLSGLYLWWPRAGKGLAGVLYPRLGRGRTAFWRDIHAVTGMWVSALAIALLLSALPWTGVWGKAFKQVRQWSSTAPIQQDWSLGRAEERAEHAGHGAGHAAGDGEAQSVGRNLDDIVSSAQALGWARPVLVTRKGSTWVVKSDAQNRTLRQTLAFDAATGATLTHERFADKPLVDRLVGIGVAAHEGQLFGRPNQLLGLIAALGLATVASAGFAGWWRRCPAGRLGAPPPIPHAVGRGFFLLIAVLALLLPLLGASLLVIALLDRVLLRGFKPLRRWIGLATYS